MYRSALALRRGAGRLSWASVPSDHLIPLAGVWQQAASAVSTFLQEPVSHLQAREFSVGAAASSASSEPARAGAAAAQRNCWQCGTTLGSQDLFFCPDCNSIQPPDREAEENYFHVFSLNGASFDVNPEALEQRYKGLQRQLHPDRFTIHSQLEQEYSDQQAALVNQAYDVLKRPLRRAHYILQQHGLGACEGLTITDPELLMYVMEAREEVESTEDKGRLQQLLEESEEQEKRCLQELAQAFRQGQLQHAAEVTTQLRYVKRIQEALLDKL